MSLLFILFYIFQLFFCGDDSRDGDAMLEEISSHQNVVAINEFSRVSDWKNIFVLDISLKNDVRMRIANCKRGENNDIVYKEIYTVNSWWLYKAIHYGDFGEYDFSPASDIEERLMGNSLEYLLDNYQTMYDLFMNAPEVDFALYEANKKNFDSIPDKGMFDVYDEETGKVIGVGKLFRKKGDDYEFY